MNLKNGKKSVEIILQNINVILNNTPMKAQTIPPTRKEVLNIYNEDAGFSVLIVTKVINSKELKEILQNE